MSARFGNSGGHGRRISRSEDDQPLMGPAIDFSKRGLRADNDFDRHRRTRAGLALATGASSVPMFVGGKKTLAASGAGVLGGATLMATNTPAPRKKKSEVGKTARYYDPEGRRQRRLGLAEAALLGGGAALGYRGGRGALRTTKLIRGSKVTSAAGKEVVPDKLLSATRRDLGQLGGAAALAGGAAAVDYHGNHPRGRHWR